MQVQDLILEPRSYVEDPPIDGFLRIWLDKTTGVLKARLGRGVVFRLIPDANGPAAGDLSGTCPNPTVQKVLGGKTPAVLAASASGSVSGTVTANSNLQVDITVAGSLAGDTPIVAFNTVLTAGLILGNVLVQTPGTVSLVFQNPTVSDITFSGGTIAYVKIIR